MKIVLPKKTAGRNKGQENIKSHYRKGIPGDWKKPSKARAYFVSQG